jgi:hypothetical protein
MRHIGVLIGLADNDPEVARYLSRLQPRQMIWSKFWMEEKCCSGDARRQFLEKTQPLFSERVPGNPLILPPGLAMLATKPCPTGRRQAQANPSALIPSDRNSGNGRRLDYCKVSSVISLINRQRVFVFRSFRGAGQPGAAIGISFTLQKHLVSLRSVVAFDAGGLGSSSCGAASALLRLSRCSGNRVKTANKQTEPSIARKVGGAEGDPQWTLSRILV